MAGTAQAQSGSDHVSVSQYGVLYFSGTGAANKVAWTGTETLGSTPAGDELYLHDAATDIELLVAYGCEYGLSAKYVVCPEMPAEASLGAGNDIFHAELTTTSAQAGYCCDVPLTVNGDTGNDTITGGDVAGFRANGGDGDDVLVIGPKGRAAGDAGNDRIEAANGASSPANWITCGAGTDVVVADRGDVVPADCERVVRVS